MSRWRLLWIAVFLVVLSWSGIAPKDYITWCLEVFPAVLGAVILLFTRERFPLTTLVYVLILVHCVVLMVGGHYTYAEVPIGDWFRETFDGSRNNYDKLGHFVQGFIPALIARELMSVFVSLSARFTNSSSGGLHCCPTKRPRHSLEHRGTCGIPSPTWVGPCSAPCSALRFSANGMTSSSVSGALSARPEA